LLFRFAGGALGTITLSDVTPSPWSWELASGENPAYPPNPDQPCYILAGTEASLTVPTLDTWDYAGKPGWYEPLQ
ncbi:gfo/Idh/MocA family oxidoreductase, partial [Klebsiella pneumoniae]